MDSDLIHTIDTVASIILGVLILGACFYSWYTSLEDYDDLER